MKMKSLSTRDELVLGRLFDPESASDSKVVIDETLPSDPHVEDMDLLKHLQAVEKEVVVKIEDAFKASDSQHQGRLDTDSKAAITSSLNTFQDIIDRHPNYASAYANRAQCLRLSLVDQMSPLQILRQTSVLSDLEAAIRLASPHGPSTAVSPASARLLASAYSQRATMYLAAARQLQNSKMGGQGVILTQAPDQEANQLEELASRDFFMGGRYGNELASAMGVRINPYAKACGNIVQEAMKKEMGLHVTATSTPSSLTI